MRMNSLLSGANQAPEGPDLMLKLPNEVLDKIFNHVHIVPQDAAWYCRHHFERYQPTASVSAVCRRFNCIATAKLYQKLAVGKRLTPGIALRHLHRTLRENPALRDHCRELVLAFYFSDEDIQAREANLLIANICRWLSSTRTLAFHDGWPAGPTLLAEPDDPDDEGLEYSTPVDIAAHHMAGLNGVRVLYSGRLETWPSHMRLGSFAKLRSLKTLELSNLGLEQLSTPSTALKLKDATFTTLALDLFHGPLSSISALVNWTQNLESFTFSGFHFCNPPDHLFSMTPNMTSDQIMAHFAMTPPPFTLARFQSILDAHRKTLTYLRIDSMTEPGNFCGFDLAGFESLRALSLSMLDTGAGFLPASSADFLLAPRLETFQWTLVTVDTYGSTVKYRGLSENKRITSLADFGPPQEEWLRCLAKAAIVRGAKLRTIHVMFCPEPDVPRTRVGQARADGYPWHRMDAIARDLARAGISLTYSPPICDLAGFESILDSVERDIREEEA